MRCRACLGTLELSSSLPLKKKLSIGRTIEQIIQLFIPQMVKSKLTKDFICSNCVNTVQNFVRFIEKCVIVEKYFIEENEKHQHQKKSKKKMLDEIESPAQITEERLLEDLHPSNFVTTVEQITPKPWHAISAKKIVDKFDEASEDEENWDDTISEHISNMLNSFSEEEFDTPEFVQNPVTELEDGEYELNFDENCAETYKMQVTNIESESLDSLMKDTDLIRTFDPAPFRTDVNLNHNRVISLPKPNKEIAEIVRMMSNSSVNTMKLESLKESETKRILLIGSAFLHCPKCKILFSNKSALSAHLKSLHPTEQFPEESNDFDRVIRRSRRIDIPCKPCPDCGGSFVTNKSLQKHIQEAHKRGDYTCNKCGKKFKNKSLYEKHLHNYELYKDCKFRKCPVCKKMIDKGIYTSHVDTHRNNKCHLCHRSFVLPLTLKRHLMTHTRNTSNQERASGKILCNICGKLLRISTFRDHVETHTEQRSFLCEKCSKTFKTRNNLIQHTKMVHSNHYYECSICKRNTKSMEAMKFHMRLLHPNMFPFACNTCGKGFVMEDFYRKHVEQNTCAPIDHNGHSRYTARNEDDPPLTCKYCHKNYKTVHLLRLHLLNSHLKNKPRVKCQYCDMTFGRREYLRVHERRHQDPEKFELTCKVCWNQFTDKDKLDAHYLKHVGSQRHKCNQCHEGFPSKHLLNSHIGEAHFSQELLEQERERVLREGLKEYLMEPGNY